jgi:pyridoxamine 5'-phosphate oxidase
MRDPFPVPDDLNAILDDIWTRWGRGTADRRSPFHTPIVGSTGHDATPEQRVMVLRKSDRTTGTLRFHTDIRSTKIRQLAAKSAVSILGYDPGAKVQLRTSGTAKVIATGPFADDAWAATSLSGRRSYLTTLPPGNISNAATSGLPASYETTMPALRESEAGRANFAIVVVTLDRLEWLHLASTGHRRAAFTRASDEWTGTWLIP